MEKEVNMFNHNITQTYSFQDASQEIIIMLLGAFLLGALLTWLLSRLFNKDYHVENSTYRYQDHNNDEINSLKQTHTGKTNTTGEVRIVKRPTNPAKTIADDLTRISGIDTKMQDELKNINISSYAELRDIDAESLSNLQKNHISHKKEIETWPHQASLATKGDWNKLRDYQGFIQRVQTASRESIQNETNDDLTQLVGINSEIKTILNKQGIYNFKQLSIADSDSLKKLINDSKEPLVELEAESWPHQAAMAEKGQFDELKIYQDFMHADSDISEKDGLGKAQKSKLTEKTTVTKAKNTPTKKNKTSNENLNDHDDLRKIEGIGPKIEEVLNNGGIYTFSQLKNSDKSRLRRLLDDAGSQFRMHNPESWPRQAGMASRAEWDKLQTYQDTLNNIKGNSTSKAKKNPKKSSKLTIAHQKDDFKKIEGIGPKIQELLNNAGIFSYKELSKQPRDIIKQLLDDAGPQFRMHEPESWPHQAKLAASSKWKELEKYQEFLISARE